MVMMMMTMMMMMMEMMMVVVMVVMMMMIMMMMMKQHTFYMKFKLKGKYHENLMSFENPKTFGCQQKQKIIVLFCYKLSLQ